MTDSEPDVQAARSSVLHPLTSIHQHESAGPLIIRSGTGLHVTDVSGNEYLDGASGLWCVNVGYGREELVTATANAMRELAYFHTFNGASNLPQMELADRVLDLINKGGGAHSMSRVFFGMSGSDANDTQVKLAWYYNELRGKPKKKKIISRNGAYHGLTVMASCLTGIPMYHKAFGLPSELVVHTQTPASYTRYGLPGESEAAFTDRLVDELAALILREGPENVAAFIAEPVIGTGGVLTPPAGYFEKVQALLKQYDILFLVDEVICGFGRVGWFGSHTYSLRPDLMAMAKGLTSGYFPLSAVAISEPVWEVLRATSEDVGIFAHGFTYSGHPVGAAVALANLDIIERENLVENATAMGRYLLSRLQDTLSGNSSVADVRGAGLMCAVEVCVDKEARHFFPPHLKAARAIVDAARQDHKLMLRALPFNDVIAFSPPFICTRQDIDSIVNRFASALEETLPGLLTQAAGAS